MAHSTTDTAFRTLHAARIKGLLSADRIEEAPEDDAVGQLERAGLLRVSARGASMTALGLAEHGRRLREERMIKDMAVVEASYERFLAVNASVKSACAKWQQSDRGPDALFDVSETLSEHLERLRPSLRRTATQLPWFDEYVSRLDEASRRALDGDGAFVTDMSVDSFHTIWFECHEDYLVSLGRSREEEEAE